MRMITEQEERDLLDLHIYLGEKQGFDVSELIEMKQTRYLFTILRLYK